MPTKLNTPEPRKPDFWRDTKQIAGTFGLCLGISGIAVVGGIYLTEKFGSESTPAFPLTSEQTDQLTTLIEAERAALKSAQDQEQAAPVINADLEAVLKRSGMQGYSTQKPF